MARKAALQPRRPQLAPALRARTAPLCEPQKWNVSSSVLLVFLSSVGFVYAPARASRYDPRNDLAYVPAERLLSSAALGVLRPPSARSPLLAPFPLCGESEWNTLISQRFSFYVGTVQALDSFGQTTPSTAVLPPALLF